MSNEEKFLDLLNNELITNSNYNNSVTENGAVMYKTTDHPLVDLYLSVSSYRMTRDDTDFIRKFNKSYDYDRKLTILFLFFLRDIRNGLGERDLFRKGLLQLVYRRDNIIYDIIDQDYIPEYGRYDDMLVLIDSKYGQAMIDKLYSQLVLDFSNMSNNKPISLLAKWLPSVNAHSKDTVRLAHKVREQLGFTSDRSYRKALSKLRRYLNVVEVDMSAKNFSNINYESVPSLAMVKYTKSFYRNDEDRFSEYIDNVSKGKSNVNVNTLYPYHILSNARVLIRDRNIYAVGQDEYLDKMRLYDSQWKLLLKSGDYDFSDMIVVRDGSCSMKATYGNSKYNASDVCDSLTILTASKLGNGQFKNSFITFSHDPQLVKLTSPSDLELSIKQLDEYTDISDTNIEKVFDLILDVAVSNNLSQSDLPSSILIISDMEFNPVRNNYDSNLFDSISSKYASYHYELPNLIFWNIGSRSSSIPMVSNSNGLTYLSGFSQNSLRLVESGKADPLDSLVSVLYSDRYKSIYRLLYEYNK